MKLRKIMKQGVFIIAALFLAACSKNHNHGADGGLESHGLDAFGFGRGQEAGEMYTTKTPHNLTLLFAYDNAELAPKYLPSVHAQAKYLVNHPGARVLIAGHTDERGSREYNIALGERRANTVADIMRMEGVNRSQIRVVSYGKERPVALSHDDESNAQNRRDEVTYESTK